MQVKKILAADVTTATDLLATTALGAEHVGYAITTTVGAGPSSTVKLQGSMDGSNWKDLATHSISTAVTTFGYYEVSSLGPFVKYRLTVTAVTNVTFKADSTILIAHGHSQSDY